MKNVKEFIEWFDFPRTDEQLRIIVKAYASHVLDEAAERAEAYTGVNDEPIVSKGSILDLKNEL